MIVLKILAVVAFLAAGYGMKVVVSPLIEIGGLPLSLAIIASCVALAHVIEPTR